MIHPRSTGSPLIVFCLMMTAAALTFPMTVPPAAAQTGAAVPLLQGAEGIGSLEQRLVQAGFVDVATVDPQIMVELEYARTANFIGQNVYGGLTRAYLRPAAAEKLARASAILRERHPGLRLLVTDAVRPRSIQHKMWKVVAGTPRQPYIANPDSGSMHNYGAAVDVTLFDVDKGERLDMGTPIYFLGPLSQPRLENGFLQEGKLNRSQIENRLILRKALCDAGWRNLAIEWWHFDAFSREYIRRNYTIFE